MLCAWRYDGSWTKDIGRQKIEGRWDRREKESQTWSVSYKDLFAKIYAILIFKHSNWLKILSKQKQRRQTKQQTCAVVEAQLVERSLPTPEVRIQSSANFYVEHLLTVYCIEKTKIKKKMPWMAHFEKLNSKHWKSYKVYSPTQDWVSELVAVWPDWAIYWTLGNF